DARVPPAGPVAGEKSPTTALALSLGGTLASFALVAAAESRDNDDLAAAGGIGIWIAPSFGHWYAGKLWTDGLTWRFAGAGAVLVGAVILLSECFNEDDCNEGPGFAFVYGGMAAFAVGGVYDIVTAPGSARAHNKRLRARAAGRWALTPVVTSDRAGLVLGGSF
ncbi:MAG: hypothetical protein K8M05_00750, partial [Deltaproteobacteria bacterium]|nr:hypothetical protein [Kofleriaceae bacterium]